MTNKVMLLRLGWFGVALGTLILIVGVSTTVLMGDLEGLHAPALFSQFVDLLSFTGTFWLAVFWRKQPELHKRLIFVATCVLTGAAFARFPERTQPVPLAYAGVDFLILLGVARDLIVDRRVHRVYLFALPLVIVGQILEAYFP